MRTHKQTTAIHETNRVVEMLEASQKMEREMGWSGKDDERGGIWVMFVFTLGPSRQRLPICG
jgi:hypothetical protein